MSDTRAQVWRTIALMALTSLGTGTSSWFIFGRNTVTRDEAKEIARIEVSSQPNPYLQDKRSLDEAVLVVGRLRDDLGTMKGQLGEILRRLPDSAPSGPWSSRPGGGK